MIKNYFLVGLRNLAKNRLFSAINIIGLATGLSVGMLILSMLGAMEKYDTFHPDSDRIYRIITHRTGNDPSDFATTPFPVAEVLKNDVPEVEQVVRMRAQMGGDLSWGEKTQGFRGLWVEDGFFSLFGFELSEGNAQSALKEPYSLILSEKAVERLGMTPEGAIGEVVSMAYGDFKVTGVLKNPPNPTHIQADIFGSFATVSALEQKDKLSAFLDDWQSTNDGYVYLRLREGAKADQVITALTPLSTLHYPHPEEIQLHFDLQSLSAITPSGMLSNDISFTLPKLFFWFMGGLSLIVMLTAGFNYTGLTIARSLSRAREIGVRKVIGASRKQIFIQFVAESVLTALIAMCVAWVILEFFLVPQVLSIIKNDQFSLDLDANYVVYLWFVAYTLLVGIIAGLLPAGYLSAFQPIRVLKPITNMRVFSRLTFRKALVVVQFSLSLIFFISVILLYDQTSYMLKADYGFNKEDLLHVNLNASQGKVTYDQIRPRLLEIPGVVAVSGSQTMPAGPVNSTSSIRKPGQDRTETNVFYTDGRFAKTFEVPLLAGRMFRPGEEPENETYILINETGAKRLGLGNPSEAIGQQVELDGSAENPWNTVTVAGVVKDFHYLPLHAEIGPLILRYRPSAINYANIRYNAQNIEQTMGQVEAIWEELDPAHAIEVEFQDQWMGHAMQFFLMALKVIGFMSGLTLIIACLGLLGTAHFHAEARIKEVGIRKILGASVNGLTLMLSRHFFMLLILSAGIAIPAAWFVSNLWLSNFAYRISFSAWHVLLALGMLTAVGILTIATQAWQAARRNPVESLRYE